MMKADINKDPHDYVDFALVKLTGALGDLQDYIGLVRHSDVSDLKSCMAQINQIMLKVIDIRGQPSQKEAVC